MGGKAPEKGESDLKGLNEGNSFVVAGGGDTLDQNFLAFPVKTGRPRDQGL